MKKKAILAIILCFVLCLSACGDKAPAKLTKGEFAYKLLAEEGMKNIDEEFPDEIHIGYEASDGYLKADISDKEQCELLTDALKAMTVGDEIETDTVIYYPSRSISFDYKDGGFCVFYFADTTCYTYDSKKDELTYYQLENYEDFFTMFDILVIANNPDAFDDNYVVYDDSDCTATIKNYEYENGNFMVVLSLVNNSAEQRIFKLKDLSINGIENNTDTFFVVGAGESFEYKMPVKLNGIKPDEITSVNFKFEVTNDFKNPSYEYETEEVSIVPNA